ncbi:DGQHR domain-containing protein [Enterobacter bugandensis]|uniref:DGQHR domain-containing protein n=1 Tax=Enterobacter bugandensis TaxID=881260 RepID=UPI0020067DC9|nr:DGQHR domain-containing protein [Enterobacter bugandensis]MCK7313950.1 DGQHR domain-containing protein [Enterobacter bugandensis]
MPKISKLGFNIGNDDIGCFVTVLDAKELYKIATVSRADDDPDRGYQRLLNKSRAQDIASYINSGNIIPGSIILSAQNGCTVSFDDKKNLLSIDTDDGDLFIIDGQHRLYGASLCEDSVYLPVCIFTGLNLQQEVQYFLDINSNQKGVPKTLRIELLKFLSEPDSKDAIRNKLFNDLNTDVNSPLYGKTTATVSAPGKLSHVPFQTALDPLLEGSVFKNLNYEQKKALLINYLNAIERILREIEQSSSRLTTSAFFQAVFKIFEPVCSLSLLHFKNYKEESLYEILLGIKRIDFDRHSGSNQQAISAMSTEMQDLISLHSSTLDTPNDLLL